MILFPYDAYKSWSGAYPPDVVRSQFRKVAAKWRTGLEKLERVAAKVPPTKRKAAQRELAIARTCHNHFESTANQVEFYMLRDRLPELSAAEGASARRRMLEIVEQEVTRKVEEAVNTIAGINQLYSRSYEGSSVVIVQFNLDMDGRKAADDVREKVAAIRPNLRDEVKEARVSRFDPASRPIYTLALTSLRTLYASSASAGSIRR